MTYVKLEEVIDPTGLREHCKVAALILEKMDLNPHTKHHIRSAIREASLKITTNKGSSKDKATMMSTSALEQMTSGDKSNLILEHVVPVSEINKRVLSLESPNTDKIQEIVVEWSILCVITEAEDRLLKDKKITKSMPNDWDGIDKYARYKKAGIDFVQSKYKELKNL